MKISNRFLNLLSYSWLLTGILIFTIAWCRWYIAITLVMLCLYVLARQQRTENFENSINIKKSQLFWALFLSIFVMWISGIGGYVVQSFDHSVRNAIFRDLINYSWPVYNAEHDWYMSYYIAFWMLPAALAKLFHSEEIGFLSQLIWLSFGLFLLYLQLCQYLKKVRLSYFAFIYFFSGLKIIICLLYFAFYQGVGSNMISSTILEISTNNAPGGWLAPAMNQLLYDPHNQTIPAFLALMMMINHPQSRFIPFIYAIVSFYAPFPFIGMTPIVLYWFIKNQDYTSVINFVKKLFTIENVVSLALILLAYIYLSSNISGGKQHLRVFNDWAEALYGFCLYIIFEFLILIYLCYKSCNDKYVLWISFTSICLFAWIQIGVGNDFVFRTNMPLIWLLCVLAIKTFYDNKTPKIRKKILLLYLIVGGAFTQIHPMLRIISSYYIIIGKQQSELNHYQSLVDVNKLYLMQQTDLRNCWHATVMKEEEDANFHGDPDSFFFKYLAR